MDEGQSLRHELRLVRVECRGKRNERPAEGKECERTARDEQRPSERRLKPGSPEAEGRQQRQHHAREQTGDREGEIPSGIAIEPKQPVDHRAPFAGTRKS